MSSNSLALGIDIGGTNTSFGLVNRRGQILEQASMSTLGFPTIHDFIDALVGHVTPLIDRSGEHVEGIGVGAPNGNYYTGEIAYAPNLPWQGVIPLASLMHEAFNLKVTLTNDANAAALGEMMYGEAKGMKDFIVITLGTGVGSGIIANGQLLYGHDGFAGEIGHMIAVRDGRKCGCGRNGCLETYASATGIVRTAIEWLTERNDDTILRGLETLTAHDIHLAAEKGDPFALELFEFTGKILGQTLADVVVVTSPEAFIFFGGLAKAGDLILNPTRRHMEDNLLKIYKNKIGFFHSGLNDADAAILGASALVW